MSKRTTILGVLAGSLLLAGLWVSRRSPTDAMVPAVASASSTGASTNALVAANQPRTAQPPATPPWRATKENSPVYLPEGYVPAWQVKPQPPVAVEPPPPPTAPPNPLTTTPPSFNPGGINGSRPPREEEP
ncbi:MAG: hypothetical protein ACXVLM_10400 [Ilumatobacteraceae bacterium]